jgi:hypothetical protein
LRGRAALASQSSCSRYLGRSGLFRTSLTACPDITVSAAELSQQRQPELS